MKKENALNLVNNWIRSDMVDESKITNFKNNGYIFSNSFLKERKISLIMELFREQEKSLIFICEHQNIDVL